jgi:hypothetical protein
MGCPTCKGTGKQIIHSTTYGPEGVVERDVEIDCLTCEGSGCANNKQLARLATINDGWCRCGNPSGEQKFFNNRDCHGYTCEDCGKLTQIG